MNGGIFYAEERRRLLWIWDEDKGGGMGITDFMGRMGVEVWGNWCKRFISFVRCIKIKMSELQ